MKIQLNVPKEIVLVKEEKFTATEIKLLKLDLENPNLVEVHIELTDGEKSQSMSITLWHGKDYKPLGTYTMEDVKNRLEEIL